MSEVSKEIEIDETVVKAIADQVTASMQPQIDEIKAAQTAVVEKEVNKLNNGEAEAEVEVLDELSKMSKEAFVIKQINAALQNDGTELAKLNAHAMKTLEKAGYIDVTKATYLNAGTTADGGAFVPNADLLKDIFTVLPNYSSVANLLREITLTEGDSLDLATLTADVIMTEVGSEGGTKAVTKPTIGDGNVAVREFAGIALLTKKLLRQSAIDVYAVVRDSFARAIAKKREQLILTDSTSGIINKSGRVETVLASTKVGVADITIKQLKAMPFKVPTASAAGGSYVFSRLMLAELDGREDTTGQPIITISGQANGGSLSGTFNGYPFVVSEVLGATDAVSTVHAVFGNWGQYGILLKQGAVDSQVFDSGTVVDGGSVSHNLIQENKVALRVENWENVGYPLPGAFTTLKTAAS